MLITKTFHCNRPSGSGETDCMKGFYHIWAGSPHGHVTKPICTNFHFCAPKIFHIYYLVSNNSTVSEKKEFNFENRVTFGEGQRMTLTFDTHVGSTDHLVQCMYQV